MLLVSSDSISLLHSDFAPLPTLVREPKNPSTRSPGADPSLQHPPCDACAVTKLSQTQLSRLRVPTLVPSPWRRNPTLIRSPREAAPHTESMLEGTRQAAALTRSHRPVRVSVSISTLQRHQPQALPGLDRSQSLSALHRPRKPAPNHDKGHLGAHPLLLRVPVPTKTRRQPDRRRGNWLRLRPRRASSIPPSTPHRALRRDLRRQQAYE